MGILLKALAASCLTFAVLVPMSASGTNADLVDVIARIDYGFYVADARLIEAAGRDLERVTVSEPVRAYYAAYAGYRLNQVDASMSPRLRREHTERCFDIGHELSGDPDWAVEALVLVAACALSEPGPSSARGLSLDLHIADALDAARHIDASHPRLLLVAALAGEHQHVDGASEAAIDLLTQAIAGFEEQAPKADSAPTWGRAEALAALGRIYLTRGQLREARDVIEQALIEAPEFSIALGLRNELSLHR